jgi:uncharacterized membrane protein YbhN (UPF0104 family)
LRDPSAERWKALLRHAPAVIGVALMIGAIYVVQREFRSLRIETIRHAVEGIRLHALLIAASWTAAAYAILTLYDRLGTIYAGRVVSYRKVAFASFCAYALSHNLGFAAVSGAAVRYRLYSHWGLSVEQIAKVIAFCSLTFGLGGMALGGAILFIEPDAVPFVGDSVPHWAMYLLASVLWGIDLGYVALAGFSRELSLFGRRFELPGWRMALLQVVLAAADVAATAAIFFALLPPARELTYLRFLGVYLASYSAGLLATIPGGLGVFDGAMLLGLAPYLDAPHIVGAILIFRLYYYVIPLFLAGALFAGNEFLLRGGMLLRAGAIPPIGRISDADFGVATGAGAVALCGFLLLSLGVIEQRPDFSWMDSDFAAVATQAGEFVPSLIGAALMVLAAALAQRVNLAWSVTLILLLSAAVFTLAQDEPLWIPGVMVLAAGLVAPYRRAFYRHARILADPLQPASALPLLTLILCVLALAVFERHVRWLARNSFWEVILSHDVSNSMRASVALTVALGLVALWRLLRPRQVSWAPWNAAQRLRYASLGAEPPEEADGVVWGEAGRAAMPFRRIGRTLLALGDPAGAGGDQISAIWRLRDLAQREGRNPAIWRAGRSLLRVYADLGLTALALDASGRLIDSDSDAERTDAEQFLVCRVERDLAGLRAALPGVIERARGAKREADLRATAGRRAAR